MLGNLSTFFVVKMLNFAPNVVVVVVFFCARPAMYVKLCLVKENMGPLPK